MTETASDGPTAAHLRATDFLDFDEPAMQAFIAANRGADGDPKATAIRLYYAVRDQLRYDPYGLTLTPEGMRASTVLARGGGFCITKAALLAACLRGVGIPARLGFADVRNHLSTERLRSRMGSDLFVYHGYAEVYLEGRWVKATPAFNIGLCEKFGVLPLEFDGIADSIFHPFDAAGQRHMEYVRDRGSRDDVPLAEIVAGFREAYGAAYEPGRARPEAGDFAADAEAEAGPS